MNEDRAYADRRLIAVIVGVGIPLVLLYGQINVDDPIITFRYAWNFANGNGLVFNPGEQVLGTTSPLFAILLGLVSKKVEIIPIVAHLLSGAALIGISILVLRIADNETGSKVTWVRLIAPIFVLTNPLLAETQGFELNLYLLFGLGAVYTATTGRPGTAGVLAAVSVLFRGDGLVLVALIGLYLLKQGGWREFAIACALPILSFSLIAYTSFGSPLPTTLDAKRAMGESGFWRGYAYGGFRLAALYVIQSPLYVPLASVTGWGMWHLRWHVSAASGLVAAWASLVFIAYTLMGIPSAFNYYGVWIPPIAIALGLGTHLVAGRFGPIAATAVFVIVCVAPVWPTRTVLAEIHKPRYAAYRVCARDLSQIVEADQAVAMVEIGILSHFSGRRILDLVGLVHPEIGPHLAAGDVSWPVREKSPAYVLLHDPPWQSIETGLVAETWFLDRYERIKTYEAPEPYRLALYRRKTD